MAEIQEYLTKILHAVFGRDVRQSIHDAIQQCYYDGKAGSIDLQARQKIETLASRMDNIVLSSTETLSGYELVEIYANSDYSGSEMLENVWSTSMLLSTTELDAVDWSHAEDVKIINVGAIDWNDGASYPDPELYKTLPYYHKDDMSVAIEMIDDAYAVSIMANEATKTYNRLYVKIVLAYKSHLSIPELEDLKVGADGTKYNTAGEAVRKQIQATEAKIVPVDSKLEESGQAADSKVVGENIDSLKEDLSQLSEEISNLPTGGSGLNNTAKNLLITILRNGVYSTDQSANITALETALSSGADIPDTPVEPEQPEIGIVQTGSILAITSGVTATQTSSVLAIA